MGCGGLCRGGGNLLGGDAMTPRRDDTPGLVIAAFALAALMALGGWVLEVLGW